MLILPPETKDDGLNAYLLGVYNELNSVSPGASVLPCESTLYNSTAVATRSGTVSGYTISTDVGKAKLTVEGYLAITCSTGGDVLQYSYRLCAGTIYSTPSYTSHYIKGQIITKTGINYIPLSLVYMIDISKTSGVINPYLEYALNNYTTVNTTSSTITKVDISANMISEGVRI